MERLRFFIARNSGLQVGVISKGEFRVDGEFFAGRTVEHLEGCRDQPNIVFAAVAFDGGYRTSDGGKTWDKIMDGDVRTFAVDPHDENVVYMGTGPVRLYRSRDRGATWEPVDTMLDFPPEVKAKWGPPPAYQDTQTAHVRHIYIHPANRDLMFVLLEHGGVLLTRDGGRSWTNRSAGIDYLDMHMIGHVPGGPDRFCVSSARGFYRTDDAGEHWHRVEQGMPFAGSKKNCYSHEWHTVPGDVPRMIVCGGRGSPGVWEVEKTHPHGHLLISDDAGDTWRFPKSGLSDQEIYMPWTIAAHPTDPATLYCGFGDGGRGFLMKPGEPGHGALYMSSDRGDSWTPVLTNTAAITTVWIAAA